MAGLSGLDVVVLVIISCASVLGFLRGFVSETVSLAAWIIAIAFVKALHAPVSAALAGPVGTEGGAAVLAFALVFGVVFLLVKMAGRSIGNATRSSLLGPFDRLLGLGFGALKGLIAATLMFLLVSLVFDTLHGAATPRPEWMTRSRTYPLLRASSNALIHFVEARRAA